MRENIFARGWENRKKKKHKTISKKIKNFPFGDGDFSNKVSDVIFYVDSEHIPFQLISPNQEKNLLI